MGLTVRVTKGFSPFQEMKTGLTAGKRVVQKAAVEALAVVLETEAAETIGKIQIGLCIHLIVLQNVTRAPIFLHVC